MDPALTACQVFLFFKERKGRFFSFFLARPFWGHTDSGVAQMAPPRFSQNTILHVSFYLPRFWSVFCELSSPKGCRFLMDLNLFPRPRPFVGHPVLLFSYTGWVLSDLPLSLFFLFFFCVDFDYIAFLQQEVSSTAPFFCPRPAGFPG